MVMRSRVRIDALIAELATCGSETVFNPWTMNCKVADVEDSFHVRCANLRSVLCACADADEVDVWIGRDLGWRGGRRTGIALVDESSLDQYALSIDVEGLAKATVGPAMRERTATEIQLARARVFRKVFFWNVFPFHPHEAGKPQSNRLHTCRERDVGLKFLKQVLALLPVGRVLTIGKDATHALQAAGVPGCSVRHPSYGGQKEFHRQIDVHYGSPTVGEKQAELFGSYCRTSTERQSLEVPT